MVTLGDVTLEVGESQSPISFVSLDIFDYMATHVGTFKAPMVTTVVPSGSPVINENTSGLKKILHVATLKSQIIALTM